MQYSALSITTPKILTTSFIKKSVLCMQKDYNIVLLLHNILTSNLSKVLRYCVHTSATAKMLQQEGSLIVSDKLETLQVLLKFPATILFNMAM